MLSPHETWPGEGCLHAAFVHWRSAAVLEINHSVAYWPLCRPLAPLGSWPAKMDFFQLSRAPRGEERQKNNNNKTKQKFKSGIFFLQQADAKVTVCWDFTSKGRKRSTVHVGLMSKPKWIQGSSSFYKIKARLWVHDVAQSCLQGPLTWCVLKCRSEIWSLDLSANPPKIHFANLHLDKRTPKQEIQLDEFTSL